jgi:hypothetical protein
MEIIGSGGYGLVISNESGVLKLFYDINDYISMKKEAELQNKIFEIALNINEKFKSDSRYLGINVPKVINVFNESFSLKLNGKNQKFLCGILMEKIIPPNIEGFNVNEQIHIGLGLRVNCNQSWLCDNGITRGFYANTQMIEIIIEEFYQSNSISLTKSEIESFVSNIAYTLGKFYREAFNEGYKLFDVEIVLGVNSENNLTINMIDFGKVIEISSNLSPDKYYYDTSYKGLSSDTYVPHKNYNDKYWKDFYEGFLL